MDNKAQYNTYVGARYVPIFAGEWDITKTYEPLMIVSYQGNSYTSKTFVPANTDINNTTYWALTGNYNAQVEEYRKEVQALKDSIEYSFVYVDDFGAKGDGVTDDTQAFVNAINYCNTNNFVLKTKGKSYAVGSPDINVKCSIDFNGATMILTGNTANSRFMTITDPAKVDYTLTQSILTRDGVLDNRLFGKSFSIISPLSMGLRYGDAEEYFYEVCVATDIVGNFITQKYLPNIITGTYKFIEVKDVYNAPIFIKNVNIRFNSTTVNLATFARIIRNNVTVENVNVVGAVDNTQSNAGVFYCHSCFNLEFNNIMGQNPFSPTVAGYIIDCYDCDTVRINNLNSFSKTGGSWPSLAMQFCNNVQYNQCHTDRIDAHFSGTYYAKGCTMQYADFSHGYGDVVLEDCVIFGNATNHSIYMRSDFALALTGNVIIKDCTIYSSPTMDCFRLSNMTTLPATFDDFNYGGTTIIFENNKMESTNFGAYLETVNYQVRQDLKVFMKNCVVTAKTGIATPRGSVPTQYRFKNVDINGVNFTPNPAGGSIFDGSYMDTVTIQNCIMKSEVMTITCPTGIFKILNNHFSNLNSNNTWFNIITGNTVTVDNAPILAASVTRQVIDGNIITADNANNQGAWQGIKPTV